MATAISSVTSSQSVMQPVGLDRNDPHVSLNPEFIDNRWLEFDKHDVNKIAQTVIDFAAETGAAYFYAVSPTTPVFVISPRALEAHEVQQVFRDREKLIVMEELEAGATLEDLADAGFDLSASEIEDLANTLSAQTSGKACPESQAAAQVEPETVLLETHAEKIGEIRIDTGTVVIGDPVWIPKSFDKLFAGGEYVWSQLSDSHGKGYAMACSTGLGDGTYPVFADILRHPHFGERVLGLHIPFSPAACLSNDC